MTRTQHIRALRSLLTHSKARLFSLLQSRSQCLEVNWPWRTVVDPQAILREIATIRLARGALRGYGVSL